MIRVSNNNDNDSQEEESEIIKSNPATKRYYELEIETLKRLQEMRVSYKRAFEVKGKGE